MRGTAPVLCLLFGALLAACASSHYVVTEGTHKRLPEPAARIGVWGPRPVVTNTVATWLQQRGFSVVEPAALQEAFDREHVRVSRSFADEQEALRIAKQLEIALIVFSQSVLGETVVSSPSTTTTSTPYPGAVPTAFSNAAVELKGVDVATGETILSATAKYPPQLTPAGPETLAILACRALATAWGFAPPGEQPITPQESCADGR